MSTVLITDMRHADCSEERAVFASLGIALRTAYCTTEDDLIRNGNDAIGFLVTLAPVTRRVMEALPNLKIIVKYGVGVDNIDVHAATELHKCVANVPDYATEDVALHALTLGIMAIRRVYGFADAIRQGQWRDDPSTLSIRRGSDLVVGMLGFGRIARQFATYIRPVAKRLCYFDPFASRTLDFDDMVRCETVHELCASCDMISIHAPLTESTRNIIDSTALGLGPPKIIINTARAGLVDRDSVLPALENGRIVGFATDVFWREPPDFDDPWTQAFFGHPNVLATPHMAWYSEASERHLRRSAAQEVARFLKGETVLNCVAPCANTKTPSS